MLLFYLACFPLTIECMTMIFLKRKYVSVSVLDKSRIQVIKMKVLLKLQGVLQMQQVKHCAVR